MTPPDLTTLLVVGLMGLMFGVLSYHVAVCRPFMARFERRLEQYRKWLKESDERLVQSNALELRLIERLRDLERQCEHSRGDMDWRVRYHARLGRGLHEPEGRFYDALIASRDADKATIRELTDRLHYDTLVVENRKLTTALEEVKATGERLAAENDRLGLLLAQTRDDLRRARAGVEEYVRQARATEAQGGVK